MGIRNALNTFNPALDIIKEKGYSIYCDPKKDDDFYSDWTAIKDDFVISAITPVELLGLVMIHENYGKDWIKKQCKSSYMEYMNGTKTSEFMFDREDAIGVLQRVLNGDLSRADASNWAEKNYLNDEVEISDKVLWNVLGCIMGIDTPSTDRDFLYCENDFQSWIDELRK